MNRKERREYFIKADKQFARSDRFLGAMRAEYDRLVEAAKNAGTEEEQERLKKKAAKLLRRLEWKDKAVMTAKSIRNQRAQEPIAEPYVKP